jgi:hypothetical protein
VFSSKFNICERNFTSDLSADRKLVTPWHWAGWHSDNDVDSYLEDVMYKSRDTGYRDWHFSWFSIAPPGNCRNSVSMRWRPLSCNFFPINLLHNWRHVAWATQCRRITPFPALHPKIITSWRRVNRKVQRSNRFPLCFCFSRPSDKTSHERQCSQPFPTGYKQKYGRS